MERSLAGMLFLVAAVAFSIAAGAWWMQRIVFTPDATRATAEAMLSNPDIRQEINTVVTGATADVLGVSTPELGTYLETQILSTPAGAAMMGPIMEGAHNRVIGKRDVSIRINGNQMVEIVRDQRVSEIPPAILPIPVVGTLSTTRVALTWIMIVAAAIGAIALVCGLITRPERRDVLRGLGEFCLAMGASMILFGYLMPVHMITAIDNSTWAQIAPHLALRVLPVVLGATALFGVCGVALLLASTSGGPRRQFSTPLSVARYRGGDNPGWS